MATNEIKEGGNIFFVTKNNFTCAFPSRFDALQSGAAHVRLEGMAGESRFVFLRIVVGMQMFHLKTKGPFKNLQKAIKKEDHRIRAEKSHFRERGGWVLC